MKRLFILLFLIATSLFAFAEEEVVNYKGMETGADFAPKWYSGLTDNNQKAFRKKFKIAKDVKIYFAEAEGMNLNVAKSNAYLNILKNIAEEENIPVENVTGLAFVTDYWYVTEDEKGLQKTYCMTVYKKGNVR
ncbi:MAG: hypothetical protein Q4B64_01425 [Spirochaetales bacterium]|nr:hypothetical protein [Spirochaetales bacterium]